MEKYKKQLFILICVLGVITMYLLVYYSDSREYVRSINDSINQNYKEETDLRGGASPMETINMFADSLENEGIEPAMYFIAKGNRSIAQAALKEFAVNGGLGEFINQLRLLSEKDVKYFIDTAEISYSSRVGSGTKVNLGGEDFIIPPGTYSGVIIFEKHIEGMWIIRAI